MDQLTALEALPAIVSTFGELNEEGIICLHGEPLGNTPFKVIGNIRESVPKEELPFSPFLDVPLRGENPSLHMLRNQLQLKVSNTLMSLIALSVKHRDIALPSSLMVAPKKGKLNNRHKQEIGKFFKYLISNGIIPVSFDVKRDLEIKGKKHPLSLTVESNIYDLINSGIDVVIKPDTYEIIEGFMKKLLPEGVLGTHDESSYGALSIGYNKLAKKYNKVLKTFKDIESKQVGLNKLVLLPTTEEIDKSDLIYFNESINPFAAGSSVTKMEKPVNNVDDDDEDLVVQFSKVRNSLPDVKVEVNKPKVKEASIEELDYDDYDDGEYEVITEEVPVYGVMGLQTGTKIVKYKRKIDQGPIRGGRRRRQDRNDRGRRDDRDYDDKGRYYHPDDRDYDDRGRYYYPDDRGRRDDRGRGHERGRGRRHEINDRHHDRGRHHERGRHHDRGRGQRTRNNVDW